MNKTSSCPPLVWILVLSFISLFPSLLWSQVQGVGGSNPSLEGSDLTQEILFPLETSLEQSEVTQEIYQNTSLPDAQGLFLVENITYYVSGQTKTWALEHRYKIKERTRFSSLADMEGYFNRKERSLAGNNIFNHVKFSYILEPVPAVSSPETTLDGKAISPETPVYTVHLFIQLEEYITLFITPPLPKISDDLFKIGTRVTDKNIGGSLMNLSVGGNFSFDISKQWHTPIPFWSMDASLSDIYFPNLNMPWHISAGYNFVSELQKNPNTGARVLEYEFHELSLNVGSEVPLLPRFTYNFTFANTFRFANLYFTDLENQESNIRDELGIPESGIGYGLGIYHSFNYSTVQDSTRNMRKGFRVWLGNDTTYNFNTITFNAVINWGGAFFQPFANDYIELSFRYVGFWNTIGVNRSIGYVRGVRSFNISGYLGNYINSTFLFTFWRWVGVWEAQIGLFLDSGITQRKEGEALKPTPLSWNNFDIGTGVEGRLHLDILKGYVIYGRLGIDLKRLPRTTGELLRFWGGKI